MKKRFMSILLTLCMTLTLLPMASVTAASIPTDTDSATPAHGRLADDGYNIYCLSGSYVTVDTYPSIRSVQLAFPDAALVVFYVGIDSSIKETILSTQKSCFMRRIAA